MAKQILQTKKKFAAEMRETESRGEESALARFSLRPCVSPPLRLLPRFLQILWPRSLPGAIHNHGGNKP